MTSRFSTMTFRALSWCLSLILVAGACGEPDGSVEAGGPGASASGTIPTADGVNLYYQLVGEGNDTLVVLHGGPGAGMNSVLPAVRPLARDRVLLLYDQRGGGRSTLPEDTTMLSAEAFVGDLEAVRGHFDLERMDVLAHSFGAVLLARYARQHADRLGRVVLHGATGPDRRAAVEVMRESASRESPTGDTALARRHRELLLRLLGGEAEDPVETCRTFERVGRELARSRGEPGYWPGTTCDAPPEAVRYYYRYTARLAPQSFGDWDFTRGLDRVRAPALVIWGARDSAGVPLQRAWAAAYPRGRLLLVPGAGKGALAYRPERVREAVDAFLKGEWPVGAEPVDTAGATGR